MANGTPVTPPPAGALIRPARRARFAGGRITRLVLPAMALALVLSLAWFGRPAGVAASPLPLGAAAGEASAALSTAPTTLSAPALAGGASASTVVPAAKTPKGKWIDVNLSTQRLTAYNGGKVVKSTLISSGTRAHPTPTGRFTVRDHIRSELMQGPGYYLPNVPYVMHFYGSDAFHGTYWHHNFGHPMSHGCINLPTSFAAWLYSWTPNGTPVYIHY